MVDFFWGGGILLKPAIEVEFVNDGQLALF